MQDHGHSKAEIAKRISGEGQASHLRDMIYGGIDGAVTTFAIVAGVQGAGLSPTIIIALGIANVLADGFSMAAGNYSGTKADLDDRNRLSALEHRHIKEYPEGEREELRQILELKGLSGALLEDATDAITNNSEKWVEIMLTDEYGLAPTPPAPMKAAIATFAAFLVAGIVPLLPFLLGLPNPFLIAACATALVFFAIGTGKSRWSLAPWWRSGLETLAIGSTAAAIAYFVGTMFHI
ncbi:Predicted Fe2+/Mn2+ transporter, VIT1/CCC1 family [Litoreibacter ascidiaceicola]|uniref:Predicted Fe2+/Mn2+ transporter, VIT1/CCC1 family n=1 Tax=Litoreibacter ascidiaceicola TaxID=1486859 RepID=A0A1M4SZM4_9RHOB|nr:VIT1/CCC1 transporter family protein [Litoreibacter ascidiaceicola]SHE37712.1 Predicted Fe2+/Mn2+ transporter, VIT1/CCC1 family [Litoreibacter ascidiaceicola]